MDLTLVREVSEQVLYDHDDAPALLSQDAKCVHLTNYLFTFLGS